MPILRGVEMVGRVRVVSGGMRQVSRVVWSVGSCLVVVVVRCLVTAYAAARRAATAQVVRICRIVVAEMAGKSTAAVRMIDRGTRAATTVAVEALVFGPLGQGPRACLWL